LAVFERKRLVDRPFRRAMLFKYAAPSGLTSSTGLLDPPCDPGYKKAAGFARNPAASN